MKHGFRILAIVNNASVNMGLQISVRLIQVDSRMVVARDGEEEFRIQSQARRMSSGNLYRIVALVKGTALYT